MSNLHIHFSKGFNDQQSKRTVDIHISRSDVVRMSATSSGCVFRGLLCVIDYRCPSYLAGEARSFLREHAIFCSLAALSRATPCHSSSGYGHSELDRNRERQVQIVCIVRISDDINHYIKLWRVQSKGGSSTWMALPSRAVKGDDSFRYEPKGFLCCVHTGICEEFANKLWIVFVGSVDTLL